MTHIEPIGERVLLKPIKEAERTKSGIYIPEAAQEKKKEGEVVAVGVRPDNKEFPVKKGDRVLYGGYSHDEIELENETFVIVELKDIAARIRQ